MTRDELASAFRRFGFECMNRYDELPAGEDSQLHAVAQAAFATAMNIEAEDE